jgi:hypothetical protein
MCANSLSLDDSVFGSSLNPRSLNITERLGAAGPYQTVSSRDPAQLVHQYSNRLPQRTLICTRVIPVSQITPTL